MSILAEVRRAAVQRLLYLPHAVAQMARPERMISPSEVRAVAENGTVIEDYPDDHRGHSCLLQDRGSEGRAIHVVCAPREDYLAIITAYLPSPDEWDGNFTVRRKL